MYSFNNLWKGDEKLKYTNTTWVVRINFWITTTKVSTWLSMNILINNLKESKILKSSIWEWQTPQSTVSASLLKFWLRSRIDHPSGQVEFTHFRLATQKWPIESQFCGIEWLWKWTMILRDGEI